MNRQEYIRLAGSFVLGITSAATVAHVMAFNNRDRPQFEYKRDNSGERVFVAQNYAIVRGHSNQFHYDERIYEGYPKVTSYKRE